MKTTPNQRNTRQRRIIIEELRMLNSHPTATELYHKVRQRLPNISLGTVYRNLEVLTQNQSINKLDMSGSPARFDGDTSPHHHVRCMECGAVDDLTGLPADIVQNQYLSLDNYDVRGYRIEFYGLCLRCKSGRAGSEGNTTH